MNIARWFAAYRILEAELRRERCLHKETQDTLERERQRFIDTLRKDSGKPPVYATPEPTKQKPLPAAIGSHGAAVRDAAIEERKREAVEGKPRQITLPPAIGVTNALRRDQILETRRQQEIANDEAIVMAGKQVMSNGDGA